jgi:uncharacterized protein
MPRVVAVIGASSDRRKFGNKAFRAFKHRGYTVVPVNPNEAEVEGEKTVASIKDVPGRVHMATFYVQPDIGVRVMEEVAAKGVKDVWLNPGADAPAVIARARALGLQPTVACSIIGIGENPGDY